MIIGKKGKSKRRVVVSSDDSSDLDDSDLEDSEVSSETCDKLKARYRGKKLGRGDKKLRLHKNKVCFYIIEFN